MRRRLASRSARLVFPRLTVGLGHEDSVPVREASGLVREASGLVHQASGPTREASGLLREASGLSREASGLVHEAPRWERKPALSSLYARGASG